MEERLRAETDLLILPHCHSLPQYFPNDFKGKIIFVERDVQVRHQTFCSAGWEKKVLGYSSFNVSYVH